MSNVKGFGAAGDGKTDDTEAIRHAVADADGRLQFSRGNYLISETIEIRLDEVGRCPTCGEICAGFFETNAGQWGRRRQPVSLAAFTPN